MAYLNNFLTFQNRRKVKDVEWAGNLATANFDYLTNFSEDSETRSMVFGNSDNDLYITGTNTDTVYHYELSTKNEINSYVYNGDNFVVGVSTEGIMTSIRFSPDGLNMYIIGILKDHITQYSLSPAWSLPPPLAPKVGDIDMKLFDETPFAFDIHKNGVNFWIAGTENKKILSFTMGTPGLISTGTEDIGKEIDVDALLGEGMPRGIFVNPDGDQLYLQASNNGLIYRFDFLTPFDINTAVLHPDVLDFKFQIPGSATFDMSMNSDGTRLLLSSDPAIYQYSLTA